ncbi:disulfide bond formation protein DsbA [Streptomyces sp. AJS327]|uniref:mycothiol-dependent nitroreductase Rv2466c family protein n=1 Tax=Streptomyces sp. AJS327 TaxID=2545265 RepID=UPI0015DE119D|nr:disulfide bond formation protein DsbA [Streptomyces sp. AJS327]MBA0050610.1 disulfide bond formation protein DsbA [Streptomyces sp. AJS327]
MPSQRRTVDFWFDPACPYTWLTSRWMREVAAVRDVTVRWRVMSLSVLNEGRAVDPEGDTEGYLWIPVRICAAVERAHGAEALGRFHTALGTALHEPEERDWRRLFPDALRAADLPEELAEAGGSTAYDAEVRASHAEATRLVGTDVGTPVLAVSGGGEPRRAFFGPCLTTVPRGEAAGRLWDGVLLMAGVPGFWELRRAAVDRDVG